MGKFRRKRGGKGLKTMTNNEQFKIGDKIIRSGRVYRIFKIKNKKNGEGKKQKIVFFRPYFKKRKNGSLICSLPVANIDKESIRRPISKKELRQLLKKLSQKLKLKTKVEVSRVKDVLKKSDPHKAAKFLKCLWIEKSDESINLTKSKQEVLKLLIRYLVEEIALVGNISLAKARNKIKTSLERNKENVQQS